MQFFSLGQTGGPFARSKLEYYDQQMKYSKTIFFNLDYRMYVCTSDSELGTDQYSTPIWWGTGESDTIMLLVIPCGDVLWCKIRWARIEIDRGLLLSIWCKWALSSKCVSGMETAPALLSDSEHVCPWPRNFIRVFHFQGYIYLVDRL